MNLTTTTATDKLNLQISWSSEYLQWFNIDVCHKLSKTHIIPDALSCLASHEKMTRSTAKGKLDELAATVPEI